jgi:hypothetical protein
MKSLAQALSSAMKEIKGIEKDMQVGNSSYGYKGIADYEVKKIYKDAFEKNGLMIIPTSVKANTRVERWEEENEYKGKITIKQKQSIFTEVETKYCLLHTSGESIEVAGYGQGVDTQDKGAGKATTYALKYALLYLALTPTGKIDDSDNTHSDDSKIPQQKTKTTPPPAKKEEKKPVEKVKPKMSTEVYDKASKSDVLESLTKSLTSYDLTNDQISGISKRIAELKAKK